MTSQPAIWRRSIGLAAIAWLAIGLYATFLLYPVVQSLLTSFTDRNPLRRDSSFVGIDNYLALLGDQRLMRSLVFTLIVTVFVAIASNALGLLMAMMLNRPKANYRLMRTLIFIPQVLSGVIVAFIWRSILTQQGLLNVTLQNLGATDAPISWIGTPELATFSICVVVSWVTICFTTVVYTASLQTVPTDLYEAARIDGAGLIARFRHVTLPMIAPGMTISVTLSLITTLKLFDIIAVLTGGGPANSTKSVAYYLIDVAFTGNRFGYASAIAILLLALTALISYGTSGVLRRREVNL
jgi:ABC-type sugar transport system permease subunit